MTDAHERTRRFSMVRDFWVADFFTFAPGSTDTTLATGVSTSYWILTVIGIAVMIAALVGWVVLEDRKLKRQAEYLLREGVAKTVHGEIGG